MPLTEKNYKILFNKVENHVIIKTRYNIKLDIYLNLFGEEKSRIKGARHIDGATDDDIIYLENQECLTIENLRADCKKNNFTYSVYVETL